MVLRSDEVKQIMDNAIDDKLPSLRMVQELCQDWYRLSSWKKEAIETHCKADWQVIGRLLGMKIGDDINEDIEAKIRALIKENERLRLLAAGEPLPDGIKLIQATYVWFEEGKEVPE